MSFLNELINSESDDDLREQLHERLDIVIHKIKFMDLVPVVSLDAEGNVHQPIDHLIELAGGQLVNDPNEAKVAIFFEYQASLADLMGRVVPLLANPWPAVTYNRVYLLDDSKVLAKQAEDLVNTLEDIAEIIHPGFFVFGNEGKNWVNFSTH